MTYTVEVFSCIQERKLPNILVNTASDWPFTPENAFSISSIHRIQGAAVRQNRLISFDHEDYWEDPISVTMQPYFVKLYRQHWKVIGPLEDGKIESIRSYALDADRMKNLKVLDKKFIYPKDFRPEDFMADCIGTTTFPTKAAKPKDVIILAWEKVNLYLKHTPLHRSQRILYDCPEDGYTIFSYRLHTTDPRKGNSILLCWRR